MPRGRFVRSRRYSPTARSTRRSYKKRATPTGKAFWPISRRERIYRFTRFADESALASTTVATTAPTVFGNLVFLSSAAADLVTTNGQAFGGSMQFQLDDVPSATDFTNLFDNYRVTGVEVEFVYSVNSAVQAATAPVMTIALDHDDATAPTGYGAIAQHDTAKTVTLVDGGIHRVRIPFPRVAQSAYNGSVFTSYVQGKANQWIDNTSANVPHYGLKFWMAGFPVTTAAGDVALRIRKKYFVETKETI